MPHPSSNACITLTPQDYCRKRAAPDGSSLHYSLLFLDAPRQEAIIAVHAFRSEVADIIRTGIDIEPAHAKLSWWRMEVDELYASRPTHPVTQALAQARESFPLEKTTLLEIIDAVDMDLHQGRYEDFKSLQLYCYRASATVSVASSRILGHKGPSTLKSANDLGIAGKLVEIIGNVGLDARHGRVYLPQEDLLAFGVSDEEISGGRHNDRVAALLDFEAQRAFDLFDQALACVPAEDRKAQRASLALAAMQRALLDEIRHDNYRVMDRSFTLTPMRKLWLTCRTWLRTR